MNDDWNKITRTRILQNIKKKQSFLIKLKFQLKE